MSGKLMKMARKDAKTINKNIGWEEDVTLTTPDGLHSLITKMIHTEHHNSYDTEGQKISSKNAHVLLCEDDLISAGYPYRNETTNIHLLNHKISVVTDLSTKEFLVMENYPSETFGMIVLILKDINSNKEFNGKNNRKYSNPKL